MGSGAPHIAPRPPHVAMGRQLCVWESGRPTANWIRRKDQHQGYHCSPRRRRGPFGLKVVRAATVNKYVELSANRGYAS
jgi:hypothetical protein